jgi:hypothetical protein
MPSVQIPTAIHTFISPSLNLNGLAAFAIEAGAQGSSGCVERITLASMRHTQLSPAQEGDIWRVRIAWPNRAVHYFGKFTSEQDAIDWINAHPRLTKPVTKDEPRADPPRQSGDE